MIKKTIPAIVGASLLLANTAHAGSCKVPGFLQLGNSYKIAAGRSATVKLVEIDDDACWLKVQGKKGDPYWMNLNQIIVIAPKVDK